MSPPFQSIGLSGIVENRSKQTGGKRANGGCEISDELDGLPPANERQGR